MPQPAARCFFAALVLGLSCLAFAQFAEAEDKAASEFKFKKVDSDVLEDSRQIDLTYAKKGLVLPDADLQAYLDSVGRRVLGNRAVPEQVEFRFRVLRDPMVQAFALPNGSIYVTTGLLSLLENEAQLAGVLAHESAHVFERHGYLENRSARKAILAVNIIQIAGSLAPSAPGVGPTVQMFGSAMQLGLRIGSNIVAASFFGYSPEMEQAADSDGLEAMTSASYDPGAMAHSFELMDDDARLDFEPVQAFYRDHFKLVDRRVFALEFAATHKLDNAVTGSEKEYLEKTAPAICFNIAADLESRRARTAVDRATRLTRAFPDNPRYRVLLADAFRGLGAESRLPTVEERKRHGQAEQRKEYFQMTDQEAQMRMLEKPEGQAALRDNQTSAETLYKAVIQSDPGYAEAHRGLGFLYEQQNKYAEAAAEYRRYLEMVAGTSLDHLRIERRMASVEKLAGTRAQP